MPSYFQLRNQANSARSNSDDLQLKKLADAVAKLTNKVSDLEDDIRRLKAKIINL